MVPTYVGRMNSSLHTNRMALALRLHSLAKSCPRESNQSPSSLSADLLIRMVCNGFVFNMLIEPLIVEMRKLLM